MSTIFRKSALQQPPSYFDRYMQLIEVDDLNIAFDNSLRELQTFDWARCEAIGLRVYAPDKWSIPDILQHLLDWERIMTYRALIFARSAAGVAPGHDEDQLAAAANANRRSIPELVAELTSLRSATRGFLNSLDDTQLLRTGISFNSEMSALAYGFTMLGHQYHHLNIIRERYFPLV